MSISAVTKAVMITHALKNPKATPAILLTGDNPAVLIIFPAIYPAKAAATMKATKIALKLINSALLGPIL